MAETILITGANRGIGLELASQYAADGWRVLACCRNPEEAKTLKSIREKVSERMSIHALDVLDYDRIQNLAEQLAGETIDILFNNAGTSGGDHQSFGDTDIAAWLQTLQVNTIAPLKIAEAFRKHVGQSRRRIIATMGSMMGSIAENSSGGRYIYRSSKAAVHMTGRSLAMDLRSEGIISVLLHPGWVSTDMGGKEAPVTPQESAAGLRRVLRDLQPDDSGRLFDYQGRELPW